MYNQDHNKFVIGVCNGFQLLIKLGVFGDNISLNENYSGRFESRFLPIKVSSNKHENIFFKDMEETMFGMWCAHKEGRLNIDNKSSFIEYSGKHMLHDWDGINKKIKGIVLAEEVSGEFNKIALLAYVRDFDSNNSGRDSHSLEVLDALRYPEVKFYSEQIKYDSDNISFIGSLIFHGVTIDKIINAKIIESDIKYEFFGKFQLTPSDFDIELPSFLSVKMKDLLLMTSTYVNCENYCHFDPLLDSKVGIFGQAGSSQTELKNKNVSKEMGWGRGRVLELNP